MKKGTILTGKNLLLDRDIFSTYITYITHMLMYKLIALSHAQAICIALQNHAYSNILKILPPKNENVQIKKSYILHISDQKYRLWVLVRTASMMRF